MENQPLTQIEPNKVFNSRGRTFRDFKPNVEKCKTTLLAVSLKRLPHSATTLTGSVARNHRCFSTVRMSNSLGVACLYLLTGVSPLELFDSGEHEWMWREFLKDNLVSDALAKVIDKMINFGTKKRYQSATEILEDLGIDLSAITNNSTQNTTQPIIYIVPSPDLKSAKNVDYTELRNLLKEGNWKGADQETGRLMCEVTDRVQEGYLTEENIDSFPKEDMKTIDKLWNYYSNGKFGFSVQAEIYRSCNGKRRYEQESWENFCQQIGWITKNGEEINSLTYSNLEFSIDAPIGHLPIPSFVFCYTWKDGYGWNYSWERRRNTDILRLCGVFLSRASFVFNFSLANNQQISGN